MAFKTSPVPINREMHEEVYVRVAGDLVCFWAQWPRENWTEVKRKGEGVGVVSFPHKRNVSILTSRGELFTQRG